MDYRIVCEMIPILSVILIMALYFVSRDFNRQREEEIHMHTVRKLRSFLGRKQE